MKTAFLYCEDLKKYSFGQTHPFQGKRFSLFWEFFNKNFSSFRDKFEIINPEPVDDSLLELVHAQEYIEVVRSASQGLYIPQILNYVSMDNLDPLTFQLPQGIEEAARLIVGATVLGAELVAEDKFEKAIALGGGLHHAKPDFGEGFCIYNDVAVAVKYLKKNFNLKKILVLDTDAHAGNGTKEIFYRDNEVLFIDIHQDPQTIYPGSGFIWEIGENKGEGFTVNIPLPQKSSNLAYKIVFEKIIIPLAEEFKPQIIIRYGGSDPHYLDGLTDLGLTLEGFKMIGGYVRKIAERVCQGKVVDFITSGYNLKVLPFAWVSLICGLLDLDIDLNLEEKGTPSPETGLKETEAIIEELKNLLKKFWKCFS